MARAFADSKGRYGYRRVKAALGTGVSEKVIRRLMAEGGLSAHVPKRCLSSSRCERVRQLIWTLSAFMLDSVGGWFPWLLVIS